MSFSLGAVLIVVGRILNASVCYRLGKVGAFFGDRFGHEVSWCQKWVSTSPLYRCAAFHLGFLLSHAFPARRLVHTPRAGNGVLRLGSLFRALTERVAILLALVTGDSGL
ncbi:MAG: hypothetical protein H0U97_21560 [Gammaproteobacteria bacterium]|nr:hypothetical protein [Gammaproteobacteria bacterium]